MNTSDFAEYIDTIMSDTKDNILTAVKEYISQHIVLDKNEIIKIIEESSVIHRIIRERIEKIVATEIDNRLRCNIYDGRKVDELFNSIWTERLDVAIKERMTNRVNSVINNMIADRLKF